MAGALAWVYGKTAENKEARVKAGLSAKYKFTPMEIDLGIYLKQQ